MVVGQGKEAKNWQVPRHAIEELTPVPECRIFQDIPNASIGLEIWKAILENESSFSQMQKVYYAASEEAGPQVFQIRRLGLEHVRPVQVVIVKFQLHGHEQIPVQ